MKPLASFPGSIRPDFRPARSGIGHTTWESMERKRFFSEFFETCAYLGRFVSKCCYSEPNFFTNPQYVVSKKFP